MNLDITTQLHVDLAHRRVAHHQFCRAAVAAAWLEHGQRTYR
jgi:hypothetical protein